jgi:hypothetical protein
MVRSAPEPTGVEEIAISKFKATCSACSNEDAGRGFRTLSNR